MPEKQPSKAQLLEEIARLRADLARLKALEATAADGARPSADGAVRVSDAECRAIAGLLSDYIYSARLFPDGRAETDWIVGPFQRITGYTVEEILALPIGYASLLPPDDLSLVLSRQSRLFANESVTVEYRIKTKAGEIRWLHDFMKPRWDEQAGRVTGILGAVQDITDRKRIEEALRLDGEIMANMVEGIVLVRATDGMIVHTNSRLDRMFGYDRGELQGKHIASLNAPVEKGSEETAQSITQSLEKSGAWSGEVRNIRKGGTPFWCHANVSSFFHPDHGTFWVGVHTDITDRKQAREALRESETRYRRLFEEATEGIVLADAETGEILDCNQEFLRLTGYDRTELVGRPQTILRPTEQGQWPFSGAPGQRRPAGTNAELTTELMTKSGEIRKVDIKGSILEIDGRKVAQGFFRDLTEEWRFRHERETTLKLLRLFNDQTDAHEFIRLLTASFQEWTGCEAVGVRLKAGDDFPYFETRGFPPEFAEAENYLCVRDVNGQEARDGSGNPVLECMCGNILCGRFNPALPFFTAKGSFWTNCTTDLLASTSEADRQARTRNRCNGEGYESVALFALRTGNETLGLIQLNDRAKGRFTPELIAFMENAADQIAAALAQRQAQRALRESEQKYRSLFENMLNGFAYCRMIFEQGRPQDFTYLAVNSAFETLTGLKDVIGRNVSEVIPGIRESDPLIFDVYGRVARTGRPEYLETYVAAMRQWFSISVYSPQKDHFVAVFDGITERKRTEEALRESETRFRTLVENADEAIFVQTDLRFVYLNPAALKLFGAVAPDQLLGQPVMERFHPDVRERIHERIRALSEEGRHASGVEQVYLRLDGSTVPVEVSAAPITYQGKSGAVVFVRDITERKRAEAETNKLEAQLFQAQKMESIGRLAGGVAHDFNNMLNVITGHAEIALGRVPSGEPLHENLSEIQKAALRSADLVRQLLAFARKQTVSPKVLDVNETVAGMLKMLRRLIGEDIALVWMPGHDLWKVKMDPSQVDQILANLAVNARDAISGSGTLSLETANVVLDELHCARHAGAVPGEYVALTVRDSGAGMSREVLDRIFEPFFTTKEPGKGTGLGLATVYGIVQQNHGSIAVQSEVGKGAAFTIYLPRCRSEADTGSAKAETVAPPRGTETLLLVEDEEAVLTLTREMLEQLGYTVLATRSPKLAVRMVWEHPGEVPLLIADVVMPGMNGRELAERLHAMRPDMQCLFMSGYTADIISDQGVLHQGINFIQKPFSLHDLAQRVRALLDARRV